MDKTKPTSAELRGAPQIRSNEFKHNAVARMKTCDSVSALALELGVRRNQLYKWAKLLEAGELGAPSNRLAGRPLRPRASLIVCAGRTPVLSWRTTS